MKANRNEPAAMRAALYLRVSSDGQVDGTSLDTQEAGCRAYCADQGHKIVMVETEAASGGSLERPGLDRIRAAIAKGDVDLLVVAESDLPYIERHVWVSEALYPRPFPIDLIAVTPAELAERLVGGNQFFAEIVRLGQVLYERPA